MVTEALAVGHAGEIPRVENENTLKVYDREFIAQISKLREEIFLKQ